MPRRYIIELDSTPSEIFTVLYSYQKGDVIVVRNETIKQQIEAYAARQRREIKVVVEG